MKYIVYWLYLQITAIECPEHKFGCAVFHAKMEHIKDSATYLDRTTAYKKYNDLQAAVERSCVTMYGVYDGVTTVTTDYYMPPYSDIRIDSIPTINQLNKP